MLGTVLVTRDLEPGTCYPLDFLSPTRGVFLSLDQAFS